MNPANPGDPLNPVTPLNPVDPVALSDGLRNRPESKGPSAGLGAGPSAALGSCLRLRAFGASLRLTGGDSELKRPRREEGQATAEYSLILFFLLLGGSAGLLIFLPLALKGYSTYLKGFYLVLGLPFP
jgi:hypothetical protein